jgi:maltodextrin utilization protein YvdJ
MRALTVIFLVAMLMVAIGITVTAQPGQVSDSEYMKQALSAAPDSVAKEAAVARMEKDGSMRTLRAGKNGFTCMVVGTDKMCNDANSMEFIDAMLKHQPPPDKVGISYIARG